MKVDIKKSLKFSSSIAVITLVLAAIFTIVSNILLSDVNAIVGTLIVLGIVLIGIIFDIVGVASTAANEIPLHAMASERVHGAKHAVYIARNADRVSTFCNDVIGDISGIVSGTASAIVVIEMASHFISHEDGSGLQNAISVLFTSAVAGITVFGKALAKTYAISHATKIVFRVGILCYIIEERLHIPILKHKRKNKNGLKNKGEKAK
ncbi:hypothetical protein [Terrilactibacillus laevilacticus]|uniref:CNNM transmembrane domain-containing protein n=1 Tax=Terrilactibacillus laevilacticus TaxID=1380157 RepID=A0ABW5PTS9_9BACI|nr:hypothetical protein [Terrilactibacillus laevilacticus]